MRRVEKAKLKKIKRRRRLLKGFLFTFLFLLLSVVGYGVYIGVEAYQAWNQMQAYEEDAAEKMPPPKDPQEPFTLLLIGLDTRDGDLAGLPDVIMLAAIDPQEKEIFLTSIPRDTYVLVPGYNQYDKINHTYGGKYPSGGINLLEQTVEQYLQVPIDYHVRINFDGFEAFIDDVLGGLDIYVEKTLYHHKRGDLVVTQGQQRINGKQALYYVRHRADAEGDFGRIRRQQQVIKEILNQTMNLRTVTRINQIFNVLGDNIQLNIPFRQVMQMAGSLANVDGSSLKTTHVSGTPAMQNGVSYVFVEEEEWRRVRESLHHHLYGTPTTLADSVDEKQGGKRNGAQLSEQLEPYQPQYNTH